LVLGSIKDTVCLAGKFGNCHRENVKRLITFLRIGAYICGIGGVILFLAAKTTTEPFGTLGAAGMIGMISSSILLLLSYAARMAVK